MVTLEDVKNYIKSRLDLLETNPALSWKAIRELKGVLQFMGEESQESEQQGSIIEQTFQEQEEKAEDQTQEGSGE